MQDACLNEFVCFAYANSFYSFMYFLLVAVFGYLLFGFAFKFSSYFRSEVFYFYKSASSYLQYRSSTPNPQIPNRQGAKTPQVEKALLHLV